jgi:hypothetical protein
VRHGRQASTVFTAAATSATVETPVSVRVQLFLWRMQLDWLRPAWRRLERMPCGSAKGSAINVLGARNPIDGSLHQPSHVALWRELNRANHFGHSIAQSRESNSFLQADISK